MADIALKLPSTTATPASGGPVSDVRGIGADASAEESTVAFAALLKDNLNAAPADAEATLLADIKADEPEDDKDPLAVAGDATALPGATDMIATALIPPPTALPIAEQLAARAAPKADEEGQDLVELDLDLDLDRGARTGSERTAPALQAAAIAGRTGTPETADGKKMPDSSLPESTPLTDLLPDAGQQAAQTIQHTDFRAHLTAAQRPATELAVATPITHPGWADDVGHQVTWLADQGSSSAELVLTPPHLGRIEISLQIGPDQSSAQFVSASPQVREALEQAMPRLREMLAGGGISLGEANVSSDHPSGERGHGGSRDSRGRDGSAAVEGVLATPARRGAGLVDLFA